MKLNYKGSALLISLVYAALGAAVLMSMYQVLNTGSADTRTKRIRSAYISFISNLRVQLNDPFTCEVLLKNRPIGGTALGSINGNLVIGAAPAPSDFFKSGPIQPNWVNLPNKEFTITKAQLITVQDLSRSFNLDKPGPNNLAAYKLRINFDITVTGAVANRQYLATLTTLAKSRPEYEVDIIANIDTSTNTIYSCHGTDTKAEACEMAGGGYDSSSDMNATPQLRCHPYKRCWVEQVGIRYTAAPALPNPAVPPTCPWPYTTPSWIGRTGGQDLWVCEWCNNRLWNPGIN